MGHSHMKKVYAKLNSVVAKPDSFHSKETNPNSHSQKSKYIQLFVRGREYLKSPLQVYLTCSMLSGAAALMKIAKHFTYELTRRLVQVVNIFLRTTGSTNSNFKVVLAYVPFVFYLGTSFP